MKFKPLLLIVLVVFSLGANAQSIEEVAFTTNNVWMLLCTFLVFIMHLGFSTLESGLIRAKNTVNVLYKNFSIIAIGILTYAFLGFNLMYPGNWILGGALGNFSFGISTPEGAAGLIEYANGAYTYATDFIFQAMFAATAMSIISGAVAERIKLVPFLIFAILYVGVAYPIIGSWKWGGGWLDELGFYDFAGSTIVHSFGGWGALVCAIILGPRFGKYINGNSKAIFGHNIPLAAIGVFLLWFGWFGFNGGSVLSADPALISHVIVNTTLGAAAGIFGAFVASTIFLKNLDFTMILNGALAGLVGVTAGADVLSFSTATITGFISGVIVVLSVVFIDTKLKIDDPVGAISVHLVCGIWGTLAVGIFSNEFSFVAQLIGVSAIGAFAVVSSFIFFYILKQTIGVRVDLDEEKKGLDLGEHSQDAYHGFQFFSNE